MWTLCTHVLLYFCWVLNAWMIHRYVAKQPFSIDGLADVRRFESLLDVLQRGEADDHFVCDGSITRGHDTFKMQY